MAPVHRNKTLATLLSSTLGGAGVHRLYLYGWGDIWAWLHLLSLPISAVGIVLGAKLAPAFSIFLVAPFIFSVLAGFLEALMLGLMPDTKWDAKYNANSVHQTSSNWQLVLILVFTLACGMGGLIFFISRTFDLILTGGSYG